MADLTEQDILHLEETVDNIKTVLNKKPDSSLNIDLELQEYGLSQTRIPEDEQKRFEEYKAREQAEVQAREQAEVQARELAQFQSQTREQVRAQARELDEEQARIAQITNNPYNNTVYPGVQTLGSDGVRWGVIDQSQAQTPEKSPLAVPPVESIKNLDNIIPRNIANQLGFFSIESIIQHFKNVALLELIKYNTKIEFPSKYTKTCYQMAYKTLQFSFADSRDTHLDGVNVVSKHKDAYVVQHTHSISGEQNDICYYSYCPSDIVKFLEKNKHLRYTYLPMTVYSTESGNGFRHDMLLIFNNRTKIFYWFDCKNREDYLPHHKDMPKNAIDILLINMSESIKLGYTYEPSPAWTIQGVCGAMPSIGQFDFVFSSAWCYLVLLLLENYESPMEFMSALDSLSPEDRFHLIYCSVLKMAGLYKTYHNLVAQNAQVNFIEGVKNPVMPTVAPSTEPPRISVSNVNSNAQAGPVFANQASRVKSEKEKSDKDKCLVM